MAQNGGFALGVGDDFCAGVFDFESDDFLFGEILVDYARTLPKQHFPSRFRHDVAAQIAIGGENDRPIARNLSHDIHRVGTGADNIAHRLNFGGAVDIRHHQMIGVGGFESGEGVGGAAIGEGAPGVEIRKQNLFVGVEDFRRFRHEVNPGKNDDIGTRFGGFAGESEGVPDVVGDVLDVGILVVVGQNDRVQVFFQGRDRLEQVVRRFGAARLSV